MSFRSVSGRLGNFMGRGVRVSFAGLFVVTAFGLVAARVSIARASDLGLNFGDELMSVGESRLSGNLDADTYHVHLNGQTIESSNITTRLPMREVLDYAEAACNKHAAGLKNAFGHLDKALATKEPTEGPSGVLTVHREIGDRGFVFCVAPDREMPTAELVQRLAKVGDTGDFGRLGGIRYISVKETPLGSRVVTAWTEGRFSVRNMFPSSGDAPGDDFGDVPRPTGSRRVLSATVEGAPAGINGYSVKGAPNEVLTQLDAKLVSAGWKSTAVGATTPDVGKLYSLGSKLDLVVTANAVGDDLTNVGYVVSQNIRSVSR